MTVDEGDAVQPGQLLGKLDDAPYRNALQQAEANVGSAHAKLSLLQAGYRSEEIAQYGRKWRSASPPSPTPTAS